MAIIKTEEIPAETKYYKEVISQITFQGREQDLFEGSIVIGSVKRLVQNDAPNYTPILDAEGNKQYITGNTETFNLAVELQENISIDGLTAQQVFAWLSKWTDYKKGEVVEGME